MASLNTIRVHHKEGRKHHIAGESGLSLESFGETLYTFNELKAVIITPKATILLSPKNSKYTIFNYIVNLARLFLGLHVSKIDLPFIAGVSQTG